MIADLKKSWDLNAADAALDQLQSKSSSLEQQFSDVYSKVREALARKVPVKNVIDALRDAGMPLSPARFNELLEREAERGGKNSSDRKTPQKRGSVKGALQNATVGVTPQGEGA